MTRLTRRWADAQREWQRVHERPVWNTQRVLQMSMKDVLTEWACKVVVFALLCLCGWGWYHVLADGLGYVLTALGRCK